MIEQTVWELTPIIGTRPACRALGVAPATIYRRRRPPAPRPPRPRRLPARALSVEERQAVLAELHSQRFVDASPAQVWATLLDEGRYLASERTMYRLLAAAHGSVRERRNQLTHPAYAKPELRDGRDRQGADRPGDRAAADRTGDADRARRPRQPDALEAGRVPARRPGGWFTMHLLGQSLSSWSNRGPGSLILSPFRWPLVTWIACSSPRWTLCNTVWRAQPSWRAASASGT